ncbi:tRNA pseudouridine(55) synthase TruB [Agromyces silvae]|uniref:tRNA pseudouridine(55) synthase TruB n=1 Tax=Agromyces silvae TaxID=3388266 RepID=UPI0035A09BFC
MTSHDVVSRVRRLAGTRKVGHAGTLDPMATGLLLLGVNDATRLLHYLVGLDKEYTATIRLGWGTTTDDAEGEPLTPASAETVAGVDDTAISNGIRDLTGDLEQVPSSVSAIKVDGKRAYHRVRGGETVELAARSVRVSEFEQLAVRRDGASIDVDVRVAVSSGTYVRALARDLGAALGVGGHLTALRRTRVGRFPVTDASALEPLDVAATIVGAADAARSALPVVELDPAAAIDLGHGKRIAAPADAPAATPIAAIVGDRLVAVVERRGDQFRVLTGFPDGGAA